MSLLIVLLWIFLDLRWSVMTLFLPGPTREFAIILAVYCFVIIWFFMAWLRNDVINNFVKVLAFLGMAFSFFIAYGFSMSIMKFTGMATTTQKYIAIGNIIIYIFIVTFIASIFTSPLIVIMYRKYFMYVSLAVSSSIYCLGSYNNFSTMSKTSVSIGLYSAHYLAVILCTFLVSIILQRLKRYGTSNKGVVSDTVKDAAPYTP